MDFDTTIREGCFSTHLKGDTKGAIIEEMIDMLFDAGRIENREKALRAVLSRERTMSTGMQFGVAIPHGKYDAMRGLATVLALKKEGVDFEALDGEPSRIFVMTLSAAGMPGPHIQYLSQVSRLLNSPDCRRRLLACETKKEMIGVFLEE